MKPLLTRALALCLTLPAITASAGDPQRFEIMHIWKEQSEHEAVDVLKKAFVEKYDINWVESPGTSFENLRRSTLRRIMQGYPPNAAQWYPSGELSRLQEMRVLNYIDDTAAKLDLAHRMPKVIFDIVSTEEHFVLLPTNAHVENWVWFNRKIYHKLKLPYPESWQQLIEQAKTIQQAGYTPIAVGKQMWNRRLIFTAILTSLSKEVYFDMMFNDALHAVKSDAVRQAFEVMSQLRSYSTARGKIDGWAEATKMVAENKAAMQFMGDWANEEFRTHGLQLGVDYDCRLVPDNSSLIIVVDGFIFPKISNAPANSNLHNEFAEVVLDPKVQHDFNLLKGSMPVIKGIPPDDFNECSKLGMRRLDSDTNVLPSPTSITVLDHGAIIEAVVDEFWNSDMSVDKAIEQLQSELAIVNAQQFE